MKYNLAWLSQRSQSEPSISYLFFWGHRRRKDGQLSKSCLSQWWLNDFQQNGITYPSAEHWMMAEKARVFQDPESEKKILLTPSPEMAKKLGRKVKNYEDHTWRQHREEVVIAGNLLKFSQNEHLKHFLINTGNRILVEASPYDKVWGIGLSENDERVADFSEWQGLNLLGFALMEVRDQLQAAQD